MSVVKDTSRALEGEKVAGTVLIGPGAAGACLVIPSNCRCHKAIARATNQSVVPPLQRFVAVQLAVNFKNWSTTRWLVFKIHGSISEAIARRVCRCT